MKKVNDDNFAKEVLESGTTVLVKFSADWCQPCKAITPLIEELEKAHAENLTVVTVDIDECPGLVSEYKIRSVPSLLVVSQGEVVGQLLGGVRNKEHLVEFVEKHL